MLATTSQLPTQSERGILVGEFNGQGIGEGVELGLDVMEHNVSFSVAPFYIKDICERGWL